MTAGSLMAAELAEQPQVLGRLVRRHVADRDQVRAVLPGRLLPGRLAGTVLLARGSSDNVAVYGRYLIELASRCPRGSPRRACTRGTRPTWTTAATWRWR
jgi:glutamine---fructose-6-phosphate transaminase (isomerizing)